MVGSSCGDQVLNIREEDGEKKLKGVLQSLFTALMSASKPVVSETVTKLISRLNLKREVPENYYYRLAFILCLNQHVR